MVKIDILVVSYHAKKELAQCLASIAVYSAPDYRLTVHDNTAVNYPLTWLWNRFVERSRCEFLAFVNSDVIVGPGWDSEAMALMRSDGKVGAASPLSNYPPHHGLSKIRKPDPDALEWVPSLTTTLKENPKRFHLGTDRTLVGGHCMILRRAAWKRVAGFDEKWSFANNDWDMNERLVKSGYLLGVCLHAASLHWVNASTKDARSKGLIPKFIKPKPGATFDSLDGSIPAPRIPKRSPDIATVPAPPPPAIPAPPSSIPRGSILSVNPIKH